MRVVVDHHVGARGGQAHRAATPDAAARPGNQRHLTVEARRGNTRDIASHSCSTHRPGSVATLASRCDPACGSSWVTSADAAPVLHPEPHLRTVLKCATCQRGTLLVQLYLYG